MKIQSELDMNDNRIVNLSDGVNEADAVTMRQLKGISGVASAMPVFELNDATAKPYVVGETVDLSALQVATLVVNCVLNLKVLLPKLAANVLQIVMLTPYLLLENGVLKTDGTGVSMSYWYHDSKYWKPIWLSNGVFNATIQVETDVLTPLQSPSSLVVETDKQYQEESVDS